MTKSSHRSVRFPPQIENAVLAYCEKTGLTYAHVLREAVRAFLAKHTDAVSIRTQHVETQRYVAGEHIPQGSFVKEDHCGAHVAFVADCGSNKIVGQAMHSADTGEAITILTRRV